MSRNLPVASAVPNTRAFPFAASELNSAHCIAALPRKNGVFTAVTPTYPDFFSCSPAEGELLFIKKSPVVAEQTQSSLPRQCRSLKCVFTPRSDQRSLASTA